MNRRRTNKSAKVPNVKLRPAAPADRANRSRNVTPPLWARDLGLDSEQEVSAVDLCPRPFQGVVVCATGIDDKTSLFKDALELGALVIGDLTDKVTHLIADEPGSAKYRCALENRIPIMHSDWIQESYEIWLRGDDVDLDASIARHRLPIFAGVVLCLSGIDDMERRAQINRLVTKHGGKYVKIIERPVKVTHLVCGSATEDETDKMKYAQKFNQRGEANIRIVWEEWFWDSIDFGGRFGEAAYKVSNPRPQRKQLPPERATPPPPSSSPPPNSSQPITQHDRTNAADLLAAAKNDAEEIGSARRVPEEMLAIWGSLLKGRGFEVQAGRLVRSPAKSQDTQPAGNDGSPTRVKAGRVGVDDERSAGGKTQSALALSSFKRANSFAPVGQGKVEVGARQPFRRTTTTALAVQSSFLAHPSGGSARAGPSRLLASTVDEGENGKAIDVDGDAPESRSSSLFKGLRFRVLGEAQGPSVKTAIKECGGTLVNELDEDVDFIIVRLVSGGNFYRQEADEDERRKYRTECWLERCIYDERICPPDEHVSFLPLSIPIPVDGSERIVLSYSGLDQSEACWIRRLSRALGITLAPTFSRHSTHLLCPSRQGAKAEKALEWGIPIVDMSWLDAIARTGDIPPVQSSGESARESPEVSESLPDDHHMEDPAQPAVVRKGKGKATINAEATILDITNGGSGSEELSSPDVESFGQPKGLLGGQWKPPATPPHTRPPSSLARSSTNSTTSTHILVKDSRAPSMASIPPPIPTQRVPSSESPSPLKHPAPASVPSSPTKPPGCTPRMLRGVTESSLGKRPSAEDEGPEKAQTSRAGKRARPPTKTKSLSFNKPVDSGAANDIDGFDPDVLVGSNGFSIADAEAAGRSLHVGYEDPGQHAEKKKLLKLLTTRNKEPWELDESDTQPVQVEAPVAKARKGPAPRRRTRNPGF
ncbi:hypothetical protein FOMPIDRAFT_101949 [Fomitopsis schrenkii]|uniref:BRCT domain-containing protein n=1 Tax=Fomitopsis schrenkii TaxID=2126942 RepID=S8EV22_FOMSC|nr:hypothetical protein FOMPIDRAFT_101949 [Fomitopsis schrenkii]